MVPLTPLCVPDTEGVGGTTFCPDGYVLTLIEAVGPTSIGPDQGLQLMAIGFGFVLFAHLMGAGAGLLISMLNRKW